MTPLGFAGPRPALRRAGVILSLLLAAAARGAPPRWIKAAEAGASWRKDSDLVLLLRSEQIRYLPPVGAQVSFMTRAVYKLNRSPRVGKLRINFPYDPGSMHLVSAKIWIVSPDGKTKASYEIGDFTDSVAKYSNTVWDQERDLIFNPLGRADAGDILGCEIQWDQDRSIGDPNFSFSQDVPCLAATFEVIPTPGGRLIWLATSPAVGPPLPGREPGSLRWQMERSAPSSKECPSYFIPNPETVLVRCLPEESTARNVVWPQISVKTASLLEPASLGDASVSNEALALVAGKSGRWARIRALTEFVQREIVYLETTLNDDALAGYRPHPAAEVLRNRYGDCKDKAALLIAMLRAIGENGRFVLLNSGYPKAVIQGWPTASFNHAIVAIPADSAAPASWPIVLIGANDREVIFDPTNPAVPLGVLPRSDQAGFGLLVDPLGAPLFQLPVGEPAANGLVGKIEATLDGKGDLAARVVETRSGFAAAEFYSRARFNRSLEEFGNAIDGLVREANPVCSGVHWTEDWKPESTRYKLDLNFNVPGYARTMEDGSIFFSPDLLPSTYRLARWETPLEGVSWVAVDAVETEARIRLPSGYAVDEVPDPWSQQTPLSSAGVSYRIEGNAIVISSRLQRKAGFYEKADYEAVRLLYDGFRDAMRRPIVLVRGSASDP
jgi:hypothetical protein